MKLKVGKYISKKGADIIINKIDKYATRVWYTLPPLNSKYYGEAGYYGMMSHLKRFNYKFVDKEWD